MFETPSRCLYPLVLFSGSPMTRNNCKYSLFVCDTLTHLSSISITHYYHWSAELFFGFWRTYSSLDPTIPPSGETSLPAPRRMIFPHLDSNNWRDYAQMNQWVVRAAFPSLSMEFMNDWKERAALSRTVVLDRVVLADRAAAMHGEMFLRTQRTAANAFSLPGSANWWTTVRNNVVGFSLQGAASDAAAVQGIETKPVITYISRQGWNRRMLRQPDHERLVQELYKLRDEHGYEVNVVEMDKLTRMEQFQLAGRTTVSTVRCTATAHHRLLININIAADHDGRARERADRAAVDAAHAPLDGDGVLLHRRLRTRLRVHDPRARDGALRVLERQVRASRLFTQALLSPRALLTHADTLLCPGTSPARTCRR